MCCPGGWSGRDPFQEGLREVAATAVTHSTRKEREESLWMAHTVSRREMNEGSSYSLVFLQLQPSVAGGPVRIALVQSRVGETPPRGS